MTSAEQLVTVVTGASSGIGLEVARKLALRGGKVALWGRRVDRLAALADEFGDAAVGVGCDVSDPGQVEAATRRSTDSLGPINALVNSAGISEPTELASLDQSAWLRTIDANLSGTFYVCRSIALAMRDHGGGGSIVNLGSDLSTMGMPSYVHYCASKAGVVGLTKALAAELAPAIRVNALCPGPVDTPMLRAEVALAADPDRAWQQEGERVPLGRISRPEEIADAVLWLLVEATYATGALVPVDGGATAV